MPHCSRSAADETFPAHTMSPSDSSADTPSVDEPTTDRSTAHVGLVCTQALELSPLFARLDRRRRYTDAGMRFTGGFLTEGIRVAVVEAGAGFAAHRRAAEILVQEHRPPWVISAGLSSSLAEDVRAGDLSLATSLCDTHGQQLDVNCPIPESKHGTLRPHLVADSHPHTAQQKADLAAQLAAGAVDTTSLAVAQICRETDTRFLSIRAILDDLHESVPNDVVASLFEPPESAKHNPMNRWLSGLRQKPVEKEWTERAITVSRHLERFLTGVAQQLAEKLQSQRE